MRLNKKAAIQDIIFVVIILFVASIVYVVGNKVLGSVGDNIINQPNIPNTTKDMITDAQDWYPTVFDGAFLFILVGLFLATAVSAFFIRSYPGFFFISLLMLTFFIFLGMVFANAFDDISNTADFRSSMTDFPLVSYLMGHYALFIMVFGILVLIFLFAKPLGGEI